nr:hypothetical protein [uncultured Bacteroides sp.]
MKTTFVLVFKADLKIKTYSSLKAIIEDFSKEKIGVSQSKLEKYDFIEPYENSLVKIDKSETKTTGDIRREKHQKL